LDEIDSWVKQQLPKDTQKEYRKDRKRKRRRFFVIRQFDDHLMGTHYDPSPDRVQFEGWPKSNTREFRLELIFEIGDWMRTLPLSDAFNAGLEIIIRWADRYNEDVGRGDARHAWRDSKPEEWSEEQLSAYLRWCVHVHLDTNIGTPEGVWAE
jgi:hypothetical protein